MALIAHWTACTSAAATAGGILAATLRTNHTEYYESDQRHHAEKHGNTAYRFTHIRPPFLTVSNYANETFTLLYFLDTEILFLFGLIIIYRKNAIIRNATAEVNISQMKNSPVKSEPSWKIT